MESKIQKAPSGFCTSVNSGTKDKHDEFLKYNSLKDSSVSLSHIPTTQWCSWNILSLGHGFWYKNINTWQVVYIYSLIFDIFFTQNYPTFGTKTMVKFSILHPWLLTTPYKFLNAHLALLLSADWLNSCRIMLQDKQLHRGCKSRNIFYLRESSFHCITTGHPHFLNFDI